MAKIKLNLKLKDAVSLIERNLKKASFDGLIIIIRESIRKGISPVAQIGRFTKYSESYRAAIKDGYVEFKDKVSPVNLTQTGVMVDSLDQRSKGNNVELFYKDEKAIFHNDKGAGKSKVIRRILPSNSGETFTTVILRKFVAICKKVVEDSKLK